MAGDAAAKRRSRPMLKLLFLPSCWPGQVVVANEDFAALSAKADILDDVGHATMPFDRVKPHHGLHSFKPRLLVHSNRRLTLPLRAPAILSHSQLHRPCRACARKKMILAVLIAVLASSSARPATAATAMQPRDTCLRRCGDIDIPYPFGVGSGCHLETGDWTFSLSCNRTGDGRHRLYNYQIEVLDMSVRRGQLRIYSLINPWCYNATTRAMNDQNNWWYNMDITNFRINDALNRFTVIGCNSLAYIRSLNDTADRYMTGCMAMCPGVGRLENGSCAGVGCCQTAIPSGLNGYQISLEEKFNTSGTAGFSPCSYAVLLEAAAFDFRTTYITTDEFMAANGRQVPLVLDWAIGNKTCEEAGRNSSAYACVSSNSECIDSKYGRGKGYLCNCSAGYDGNPYLLDGCQGTRLPLCWLLVSTAASSLHGDSCMPGRFDRLVLADINECQDERYPCSVPDTCVNTIGGYSCVCPEKTSGNAYNGTCEKDKSQIGWEIAIGVSISVIVLIATASCAYMIYAKRRLAKIKREYFEQHGGLTLFDEMRSRQGLSFKLFTQEELEEATGRFDERNVIGKGANGTVYKGTTKDGDLVAIKKCRLASERQQKEFGKEMLIVSQINHRYIVKLYGCCLEVEIAHQTAEALSYLHSWASPPILHGDVKTSNILLDADYTAKVSDFGASTLAPTDEAQFVTFVQGTCGYLDPEYMRTCKLTDKSDVYSFGVVLLELLTCRKALNLEELEEEKYLSSQFLLVLGENRLEEMLDPQIKREQSIEVLEQAAELAKRCLEMLGENRPSMREVAEELHRLSKLAQHPWGPPDSAELVELLRGSPSPTTYSGHSGSGVELSSTRNVSFTDTAYIGIQSPR
ncbi:Wall-associated receptor kinase 5 [Triticum urartu]|uniref:Wall-associated receptor kinase 5 n=1 Tax=Triticum urartu TaxID=4572 RepID=M7Z0Y0_TRIUA|nr:Wall-associated receptor kinase 5 [Triticum urartu]